MNQQGRRRRPFPGRVLHLLNRTELKVKKTTHIFIVNNNKLFVSLLGYIFTKNELYSFTEFESGEECLHNLHLKPSLIILDFKLQGMNGYDTLLEIKEQLPSAYVIALLESGDGKTPSGMKKAGADEIIFKEESNFVKKITDRTEQFLAASYRPSKNTIRGKRLYYYILIIILFAAGIYYYQ
jgi:DNA-binding NarL/FixJ family response regulator